MVTKLRKQLTADLIFDLILPTPAEIHGKEDCSPDAEGGELSDGVAGSEYTKHEDKK